MKDFRDDVTSPAKTSSRRPNVCMVEVLVEGWPMHLVVTVQELEQDDELLCDAGALFDTLHKH